MYPNKRYRPNKYLINIPASLSISCNCSPDFISLNFCGIKLHTLMAESLNPTANKLESSATSAAVTLSNILNIFINYKIIKICCMYRCIGILTYVQY